MTFARRDILRKIPTGPNPAANDYLTLLSGKLRALWDPRFGGEFGPGVWLSHTDRVGSIKLAPPAGGEPLCVLDGANFRGQRIVGITKTPARRMYTQAMPNVVTPGARPEVFVIARLPTAAEVGNLCGCGDVAASSSAGASLWCNGSGNISSIVGSGQATTPITDTANVHLYSSANEGATTSLSIDNVVVATGAGAGAAAITVQAAVGGFQTGFGSTVTAFVALWGIVCPVMTTAERARLLEIARNDWGF